MTSLGNATVGDLFRVALLADRRASIVLARKDPNSPWASDPRCRMATKAAKGEVDRVMKELERREAQGQRERNRLNRAIAALMKELASRPMRQAM